MGEDPENDGRGSGVNPEPVTATTSYDGSRLRRTEALAQGMKSYFVLFLCILLLKLLLMRFLLLGDYNPLHVVFFEASFLVFALGMIEFLVRGRIATYLAADALLSIALVVAAGFAVHYGRLPSLDTLPLLGEPDGLRIAAMSMLRPAFLLFFADLAILLPLALFRNAFAARRPLKAAVVLVLLPLSLIVAISNVYVAKANSTRADLAVARVAGVIAREFSLPAATEVPDLDVDGSDVSTVLPGGPGSQ